MTNINRTLADLDSKEFENFTYDLLQLRGLRNLIWRTPGADGGRDIEGEYISRDFSGATALQNWYVECKRYNTSLDWPTVWKKLCYADNSQADFLLICTTSTLSPNCETEVSRWNKQRRSPQVRSWKGYEIEGMLTHYPQLAIKYGLLAPHVTPITAFVYLSDQLSKIVHATYSAHQAGANHFPLLEASAALSELFSKLMSDFQVHGKMRLAPVDKQLDIYNWIDYSGAVPVVDRHGFRALLCVYRLLLRSERVAVSGSTQKCKLAAGGIDEDRISSAGLKLMKEIGLWMDIEMHTTDNVNEIEMCLRR